MSKITTVLFLCTHNSARSLMAEGILNYLYPDQYKTFSAGTLPTLVNPFTIQVLKEINIDISSHLSKSLQEFKDTQFDIVVTVYDNAKEICAFSPGKIVINQSFPNPVA